MSFWEDSSPVVKGTLVVGVVGALYLLVAVMVGLPPFPSSSGCDPACDEGVACVDAECVQESRGIER